MYTVKPISSGTMFKVVGFQISNLFFAQNTVLNQVAVVTLHRVQMACFYCPLPVLNGHFNRDH